MVPEYHLGGANLLQNRLQSALHLKLEERERAQEIRRELYDALLDSSLPGG